MGQMGHMRGLHKGGLVVQQRYVGGGSCLAWSQGAQASLPKSEGSSSHRAYDAKPEIVSPCVEWALPCPQPSPFTVATSLPSEPHSDRGHTLCPPSPAPHGPLLSQGCRHLLEVTLNSLPLTGPQFLPASAEEVGTDAPESPGALVLGLEPGSCLQPLSWMRSASREG